MNWKNILTVYLKELRDSLRDRRTLISVIVIPTFVMPAMFFGVFKIGSQIVSKAKEEIPSVMILGGEDSPAVVAELKASKKLRVVAAAPDWKQLISDKKVRAAVQIPAGFEAGLKAGAADPVVKSNRLARNKTVTAVLPSLPALPTTWMVTRPLASSKIFAFSALAGPCARSRAASASMSFFMGLLLA